MCLCRWMFFHSFMRGQRMWLLSMNDFFVNQTKTKRPNERSSQRFFWRNKGTNDITITSCLMWFLLIEKQRHRVKSGALYGSHSVFRPQRQFLTIHTWSMYVEYYYRRAISLTGMRWIIQFLINHLTRNSGNLTLAASSRLSYSMQYFLMQTSATAESGYMPTRFLTAALKMTQFFVKIVTQHLPHSPFAIRYTSTWFLTRKYPKNEWHKKKILTAKQLSTSALFRAQLFWVYYLRLLIWAERIMIRHWICSCKMTQNNLNKKRIFRFLFVLIFFHLLLWFNGWVSESRREPRMKEEL